MKKIILLLFLAPLLFGSSCALKNNSNNNTSNLNQSSKSSFTNIPSTVQQQFDSWKQFRPEMKFCQGSEGNIYVVSYTNLQSSTYYYNESGVLLDKYFSGDLELNNNQDINKSPIDLNKYSCQIIK